MARAVDRGDPGSLDPDVAGQLLAFVEKTSDLVGVVDEQSRVLYLNEAARKRLGVGDTTDLTTVDMFPPQAFARYYDEIRPALLRSGTWHGELPVITGSGVFTLFFVLAAAPLVRGATAAAQSLFP